MICDYFGALDGFGLWLGQFGFDCDCAGRFLCREDFGQKLFGAYEFGTVLAEQLHYISNNQWIAVAVYCKVIGLLAADCNLVDNPGAIGDCAEQYFAGIEFCWFRSSRPEYLFYDGFGLFAEDLNGRYCTGALAGSYCSVDSHK